MKQIIRLTESDLHRIVKESVQRILKEEDEYDAHFQPDDNLPDNVYFDDDAYESPNYNYEKPESFEDRIIDDLRISGYDITGKSLYDVIEDLMINYGCTGNVAKVVANKLGVK